MKEGFWALPKQVARANVSDGAKLTYAVLFTRKNGENQAFPTRHYIAEQLGCSVSSIDKYLKQLKGANLIVSIQRGLKKSNLYELPDFTSPDLPNLTTPELPDVTTPIVRTNSKNNTNVLPKVNFGNEFRDIESYFIQEYRRLFGTNPAMTYGETRMLLKRYLSSGVEVSTIKRVIKSFLVDVKYWEGDVKFRPSPSFRSLLGEKQFNKYLAKKHD